jgi:hypothetical protein
VTAANQQLWAEERTSRVRIFKRVLILLAIFLSLLGLLCIWLTQPILGRRESPKGLPEASAERLREHVTRITEDFYPRNSRNLQNLNGAADYIRREFEKAGGAVSEQTFNVDGATYRNVILNLGKGDEKIIVGAHYDAAFDTPGADDNASGVAGLIELATLLGNEDLPAAVELVAYSLEEPPFFGTSNMGSYHHAKALVEQNVSVKMMICLEMIGYYSNEPNTQRFPVILGRLLYPTTGNFTAVVGNFSNVSTVRRLKYSMNSAGGAAVYSLNAPASIGGVDLSDHRNYWKFGYDAVMVTDTAFFRNSAYHTTGDVAPKLDYYRMAKVVDGVNIAILDAAK